jgi:hypothetical protein
LKGRPTAQKVYPLPWDKKAQAPRKKPKPLTAEESKKRFEALIERLKDE